MSEEEEITNNQAENQEAEQEIGKIGIDKALEIIISCHQEVTSSWDSYIREEYNGNYSNNGDPMVDIITIVEFVVGKIKNSQTSGLKELFSAIEEVLENGDNSVKELIVVGFLEGLQNNCEMQEVDYHTAFNGWFNAKTQRAWDGLIYLWESADPIEVKQQNLLNFRI